VDELLDSLPCGVVSFTDEGRVLLANDTLGRMLREEASTLVGRHIETLLTVAGRIFYQTHFFPLLRLHGKAEEVFLLLRRADGTELGVLVNGARRRRDGSFVNDCVLLEVRERRKYEDELLRARREAEQANAALAARTREVEAANHAKTEFLTTMSHELRTPLNAIGGYVQLIELGIHGPVTEQQRETLGRVTRSQQHLLRLINDLLNLARIESGRVDFTIEDMSLADAVSAVTPMIEPQMAAGQLTFASSVDAELRVRADREKVQQILLNLLSNAVKFTPAGGRVRLDASHDADSKVRVRVTDTGIGIQPEKLDAVFEPFVRLGERRSEGTGLGLAISRDLARGMGGDLAAHSGPAGGSVFTLTLPGASQTGAEE
jgi:signal transduction histidine kinase